MKHAKGPWNYFKSNGNHIIKSDLNCIADIYAEENSNESQEEANAKLIAAAPDLLEALIEANKTINIYCGDKNKIGDGSHNGRVMEQIANAIKKVTE